MKTIDGTLIIMNDGEQIYVNHSKGDINNAIDQALSIKRNYITINELNRDIYFNYIKDKREIKRILSLPEPEIVFTPMTEAERKQFALIKKDILEKTFEGRKKRFFERRDEILKQLEKDEQRFGLETTLEKIEKYNQIKLDLNKKKIINKKLT